MPSVNACNAWLLCFREMDFFLVSENVHEMICGMSTCFCNCMCLNGGLFEWPITSKQILMDLALPFLHRKEAEQSVQLQLVSV